MPRAPFQSTPRATCPIGRSATCATSIIYRRALERPDRLPNPAALPPVTGSPMAKNLSNAGKSSTFWLPRLYAGECSASRITCRDRDVNSAHNDLRVGGRRGGGRRGGVVGGGGVGR